MQPRRRRLVLSQQGPLLHCEDSEMGQRILEHDWPSTPLGPLECWPAKFAAAVEIMLCASTPMGIYWGPDLLFLYNDEWRRLLGHKHPHSLGQPAREVFAEAWDLLGPPLERVYAGGEVFDIRDQCLPLDRNGRVEDAWFDYSLNPIPAGQGRIGGVLHIAEETTREVRAEQALHDVHEALEQRVDQRTGELLRQTQRLRRLANQLTETEQRERRRLAELLHDGLQQLLVAGKMQLKTLPENDETWRLQDILEQAIDVSRSLAIELSPPALHASGLPEALQWLARWFRDNHLFEVTLREETPLPRIGEQLKTFLFNAVRELLLNAVKHSGTRAASVHWRSAQGHIRIAVSDQGVGFDPSKLDPDEDREDGFGLFSMRERLIAVGGRLEVESQPGEGTRFILSAPAQALKEEESRVSNAG